MWAKLLSFLRHGSKRRAPVLIRPTPKVQPLGGHALVGSFCQTSRRRTPVGSFCQTSRRRTPVGSFCQISRRRTPVGFVLPNSRRLTPGGFVLPNLSAAHSRWVRSA